MASKKPEYHLPPAQNKQPELKTEFADLNEKGTFVNEVLGVSTKAMTDADTAFGQFLYPQAEAEYIVNVHGIERGNPNHKSHERNQFRLPTSSSKD